MIRKARLSDLPSLLKLYDHLRGGLAWAKSSPTPVSAAHKRALVQLTRDPRQRTLVSTHKGKVVGTCTLYILPRVYYRGKPWAILDSIVVAEGVQGLGTGTALIKHAISLAKKAGCGQVNLTSNTQRKRAHRFYESLGFEPTYVGFKLVF